MSETNVPAAEAMDVDALEVQSYELAFHVLPTVAEGEVSTVFDAVKNYITSNGGECGLEEAPARIDLAYEVVKHIEGKNRRFTSAYFGWVRFTTTPDMIAAITEEIEANTNVLRHLLIKLTRKEEEQPFYYHEALASQEQVTTVDAEAAPVEAKKEEKAEVEADTTEETTEEAKKEEEPTS